MLKGWILIISWMYRMVRSFKIAWIGKYTRVVQKFIARAHDSITVKKKFSLKKMTLKV